MEYSFHIYNKLAADGISVAADRLLSAHFLYGKRKRTGAGICSTQIEEELDGDRKSKEKPPVVVCVGSDLAIGDSLGPIVGSMLKYKTQGLQLYIYGTLAAPVTAKEIP